MPADWLGLLPPGAIKLILVLFLSFLFGLEREEHKATKQQYSFGGVRTFPLIGLTGYVLTLIAGDQVLPLAAGLIVIGAFLLVAYRHKLVTAQTAGVTTEMSAIVVFLVGALVGREEFWLATSLTVVSLLLLELKTFLESLTRRISGEEIFTFTKFLFLTAVILPVLPNQAFPPFDINPRHTWLIVVAVSGVSYGSYVIQRINKGQGGVMVSAVLGGAYSSTVTTVSMARQGKALGQPHLFAGGILVACGMMYLRLGALVSIFNRALRDLLLVPFVVLAVGALLAGWLWSRRGERKSVQLEQQLRERNPLELRPALVFAVMFLAVTAIVRLVRDKAGASGIYALAAVMGVADVDPFTMSMTEAGGTAAMPAALAAGAIVIAAGCNNIAKGVYAYLLSDKQTGRQALALLASLGIVGLLPLALLIR